MGSTLPEPNPGKRWLRFTIIVFLAWLCAAIFLFPAAIRSAWAGESLPLLNRIISGRDQHPVERYLGLWWRFAAVVTLAIPLLAYALFRARGLWRRIPDQLRRITAALPASGIAGLLLVSTATGLMGGLAEAADEVIRHRIQHLPTGSFISGEVFWLAPLTAVVSLAVLATLFHVLDRMFRARGAITGIGIYLIFGITAYSFLKSLAVGVAGYAVIVLSAGFAVASVRALLRWKAGSRRLLRAGVPALAGAIVLWAAAVPMSRRLQERRALGQLPPASVDAPNVLIVIWDAVRAQNLSVYGYERPTTPVLERLAQRGVLFERAFSTAPWSLPSHASIFTGRIPPEMTAGYSSPMDDSHETLSEALARAGYATGGFTGNLFYGSADYGIARGFTYYDSRPPLNFTTAAHTWWLSRTVTTRIRWSLGIRQTLLRRRADDVSAAFRKWVRRQDDRPFLAVLNHFDAHEPYLAPAPFNVAFSKTQPRYWLVNDEEVFTDEVLHDFETAYDTCILYLDSELEKLLDFLDREGELDNTLIIVTADHGEEFGEYHRRVVGHSKTLRAHSLRVPLLIVPPGGAIAERRREVASIRDIPATVMASLGLQDNQPFPGIPLLNAQARTVDPWSVFQVATMEKHRWARPSLVWPSAAGNMFSLFAGKWHYIVDGRDGEQLYDMDNDPRQRENLIAVTALEDVVERFRVALDSLVPTVDGERLARRPGR